MPVQTRSMTRQKADSAKVKNPDTVSAIARPPTIIKDVCPICIEYCDDETNKVITHCCNHEIHSACLRMMLTDTCPFCRRNMGLKSIEPEREHMLILTEMDELESDVDLELIRTQEELASIEHRNAEQVLAQIEQRIGQRLIERGQARMNREQDRMNMEQELRNREPQHENAYREYIWLQEEAVRLSQQIRDETNLILVSAMVTRLQHITRRMVVLHEEHRNRGFRGFCRRMGERISSWF